MSQIDAEVDATITVGEMLVEIKDKEITIERSPEPMSIIQSVDNNRQARYVFNFAGNVSTTINNN